MIMDDNITYSNISHFNFNKKSFILNIIDTKLKTDDLIFLMTRFGCQVDYIIEFMPIEVDRI